MARSEDAIRSYNLLCDKRFWIYVYHSCCFFIYILPSEFHVIISIENGGGCLYLSGVKISDLVPFTVSQTLVDYQIPNWYLFGCFSLHKMPEISITRTILMI